MFNDKYGLTLAVLEGRKTQTRRVIKLPISFKGIPVRGFYKCTNSKGEWYTELYDEDERPIDGSSLKPKYEIGEVVAIAQSYKDLGYSPEEPLQEEAGYYPHIKNCSGWTNKMFVRADLMPHHIRIINIKIERLQDISDGDCAAEGIRPFKNGFACYDDKVLIAKSNIYPSPREAYAVLIDRVSGKGTWESNPYVFVYEFELVD